MSKQSPIELEHKRQKSALLGLCNRIKMQFSIGRVKTWADVYQIEGRPDFDKTNESATSITFPQLKEHLDSLTRNLEDKLNGKSVNLQKSSDKPESSRGVTGDRLVIITPKETPTVANKESVEEKKDLSEKENYGLVPSLNEKCFFYWFQKKAIVEGLEGILKHNYPGQLLLSSTGTGKTYIAGGIVRRLVDMKFADQHTFGATRYLYITRATIVEQTKRVFEKYFNLGMKDGVEILNVEQLRSRVGAQWVKETCEIVGGKEVYTWVWRKMLNPVVVLSDESQFKKNEGSIQHQIMCAFNEIKTPTWQIDISATPFTRVSEAKCFAVSTRKPIADKLGTGHESILTNATWPTYAQSIAGSQSVPTDYNEAAVERLTKDLEPYIIRVRGVRPQFDAVNKVEMIDFKTQEEANFYHGAYERYLKEKAKLEAESKAKGEKPAGFALLVQFLKFRMAAEFCRKEVLADKMYNSVVKDGKAAVAALNFKASIIGTVRLLVEKHGVSRDQISLIWGGGKMALTKKEKSAIEISEKAEKLLAAGLSQEEVMMMLDITQEDLVRAQEKELLGELPESLRLGPQSPEERQREIDRFQTGKTLFCFYTFRAGGVGLSLHHSDEQSSFKCRRKESGYAIEEDIPKVPIRPRRNYVAPTYSAIELVQGLGRCPRLTSLSETEQFLLFYRGTIEQDVSVVVGTKLKCVAKVVRQRESWQDMIVKGVSHSKYMSDLPPDNEDDSMTNESEDE